MLRRSLARQHRRGGRRDGWSSVGARCDLIFRQQILLYGLPVGIGELHVVEQDFRDVALPTAAGKRAVLRQLAGPDGTGAEDRDEAELLGEWGLRRVHRLAIEPSLAIVQVFGKVPRVDVRVEDRVVCPAGVKIVRLLVPEHELLVTLAEGGGVFAHDPEGGADIRESLEAKGDVGAGETQDRLAADRVLGEGGVGSRGGRGRVASCVVFIAAEVLDDGDRAIGLLHLAGTEPELEAGLGEIPCHRRCLGGGRRWRIGGARVNGRSRASGYQREFQECVCHIQFHQASKWGNLI